MSLSWLRNRHDAFPRTSLFILRAFVVAGVAGLVMAAVTWLPNSTVPTLVQRIVPARFLNFVVVGSMAVVIGLLASQKSLLTRVSLACLVIGVPLLDLSRIEGFVLPRVLLMVIYCALVGVLAWWPNKADARNEILLPSVAGAAGSRGIRALTVASCIMITVLLGPYMDSRRIAHEARFDYAIEDWSNDPFYAQIHVTGGMLATSSMRVIQLRTRQPILLDHDVNMLAMSWNAGRKWGAYCGSSMG